MTLRPPGLEDRLQSFQTWGTTDPLTHRRITNSSSTLLCETQNLPKNESHDCHWNLTSYIAQRHSNVCLFYRVMTNLVCRFWTTSTATESSGMTSPVTTWNPSSARTATNCWTLCAPATQASVCNLGLLAVRSQQPQQTWKPRLSLLFPPVLMWILLQIH